jgi:hypothetical protein
MGLKCSLKLAVAYFLLLDLIPSTIIMKHEFCQELEHV